MNTYFKVFIFTLIICLFPLKLPAAEQSPFEDPNITISMDFQDASLKDILKIFSMQSNLNFIASEIVQDRKITLFLDKVSIKEAMDKLFKANNLTYELDPQAKIFIVKDWGKPQVETITRVFYLKHATVSTSPLKEEATASSSSAIGASGASGGGTKKESGITEAIKANLSPSPIGQLIEDARTNSFTVTDIPSRMPVIEKIIASLDIPVPQVLLEVEMLDVSKNVVDQLGFAWSKNPFTLVVSGHNVDAFIGDMALRSATIPGAAGAVVFGHTFAQTLDYLRTNTETKYLARPKLLTLNNEPAEIFLTKDEVVGREDTVTAGTTTTTTSEFKRSTDLKLTPEGTGIFLRVTPQINIEEGEITMVINPKSSTTSTSPLSITTATDTQGVNLQSDVEVRGTKSIVKVRDGDTVILGGLLHYDKLITSKRLPLLADIPIIGALFRHKGSDSDKDKERELIVLITPHIVKDSVFELAQAKKSGLLSKEQNMALSSNRQTAIDASLNSFEKIK